MRLIKRYTNRRLYDTVAKETITHQRLKMLVDQGESFKIIDTASKRDVTLEILGRLISAEGASGKNSRQVETDLQQEILELLRNGGQASMKILRNTVLASIGAFNVTKKKAEEVIDQLIKSGDLTKSQRKEAVLELIERADKSTEEFRDKVSQQFSKQADKVSKQASKVGAEVQQAIAKMKVPNKSDFDKLNKKFNKLNKSVERLEKKISSALK